MSIDPKKYILNLPSLQQFQCMVCLQVQIDMMRCSGPCKSILCLRCASTYSQKEQEPSCPVKCSFPLRLQPIPGFNPQFTCPFAAKKCLGRSMGLDEFGLHCRQCQEVSIQILQQKIRMDEYVCMKGHPLLFFNKAVQMNAFNGIRQLCHCNVCGIKQLCPSFCYKCSQPEERVVFCNKCRPLPCTRDVCPIGHALQKVLVKNRNFNCDLCGHCIILFSQFSYQDRACNFDICERCYQQLPEYHPRVPIEESLKFIQQFSMMNQLSMGFLGMPHGAVIMPAQEEQQEYNEGQQSEEEEQEQGQEAHLDAMSEPSESDEDSKEEILHDGHLQGEQNEEQQPSEDEQEENELEEQEWSASESQNSEQGQEQEQGQYIQKEQPIIKAEPDHQAIQHVAQESLPNASYEEAQKK